jgi:type IV pilus assembly protein PilM
MQISLSKRPQGTVGLDVDGSFVAAAIVDEGMIGRVASMELQPGVAVDGEVVDPPALSAALKAFFKRHSLPRTVHLGVANQQIVVRQLEIPLIEDEGERDAAVRFQAAEAIAMPLDEAVVDYQATGVSNGTDGVTRERLLVVAAREAMVDQLVAAVKGAGLKPAGVDLSAFALVRMLSDPGSAPAAAGEPARVICHLGGITNLAIAVGSTCVFTRPLRSNWSSEDADGASSLAEEIRLSIDFHMTQPEASPVREVVLAGPGAGDGQLAGDLATRTGLEVTVAEPLGRLGTHTVPSDDDPYRYTIAAGLALGDV